jgi:hypothetical protein
VWCTRARPTYLRPACLSSSRTYAGSESADVERASPPLPPSSGDSAGPDAPPTEVCKRGTKRDGRGRIAGGLYMTHTTQHKHTDRHRQTQTDTDTDTDTDTETQAQAQTQGQTLTHTPCTNERTQAYTHSKVYMHTA